MDYRKEINNACREPSTPSMHAVAKDLKRDEIIPVLYSLGFQAGAKRSEELLLADENIINLRKVWESAPDEATGITIMFIGSHCEPIGMPRKIPRPKPAWEPRKGDAVFVNLFPKITVGKILGFNDDNTYTVVFAHGDNGHVLLKDLKPFTPENIGKRWEEL